MTIKELHKHIENNNVCFRSCWNCNSAHERLKKVDYIIYCFECGKRYYKGKELKIEKEGSNNERD